MPFVIAVRDKRTGKVEYCQDKYGTRESLQEADVFHSLKSAEGKRRHTESFHNGLNHSYPDGVEATIIDVKILLKNDDE